MSRYMAVIEWSRDGARFTDNRYSRAHRWRFDGGVEVPASASPQVVPLPMSVAAAVDPEEAFVASLSSCHMLFFLSLAAKRGFVVDDYRDEAGGVMAGDAGGRLAMTRVTLHPAVALRGRKAALAGRGRRPAPRGARGVLHRPFGQDRGRLRTRPRAGLECAYRVIAESFHAQGILVHPIRQEDGADFRPAGHLRARRRRRRRCGRSPARCSASATPGSSSSTPARPSSPS